MAAAPAAPVSWSSSSGLDARDRTSLDVTTGVPVHGMATLPRFLTGKVQLAVIGPSFNIQRLSLMPTSEYDVLTPEQTKLAAQELRSLAVAAAAAAAAGSSPPSSAAGPAYDLAGGGAGTGAIPGGSGGSGGGGKGGSGGVGMYMFELQQLQQAQLQQHHL